MRSSVFILIFSLSWALSGQITEENVSFNHGGCAFQATFSKPTGSGKFSTIVLVPGSGQNDRNGQIVLQGGNSNCLYPGLVGDTLRIYQNLAHQLSDSGYAVLRYDEITLSCPNFSGAFNYENVFLPALSGLDYLKTRPDVDTNRLILAGHSEGAMLIAAMARQRNDVQALISIAGARTPFDSLLAEQLVGIARQCNGDTAMAKLQANQVLQYFNFIRSGTYNASTPPFGGVAAAEWHRYINANDSVAMNYQLFTKPVLFLGMGNDFNVPPAELQRFQQELGSGADFYSLPGLNHYLTSATNPAVSNTVGDTIVQWLRQKRISVQEWQSSPFEVFPNPFQERLKLEVPHQVEIEKVALLSLQGEKVWEPTQQEKDFWHLPNLPKGLYILQVHTSQGLFSRKLKRS